MSIRMPNRLLFPIALLILGGAACWTEDEPSTLTQALSQPSPSAETSPSPPSKAPIDEGSPVPINMSMTHWVYQLELPKPAMAASGYGRDVAIEGTTAVVSDRSAAQVTVLERTQGVWSIDAVRSQPLAYSDDFGGSIALRSNFLAVGAPTYDDVGSNSGAVWVYLRDQQGNWSQGEKLAPPATLTASDRLGTQVAIGGTTVPFLAVSAKGAGTNGRLYVYSFQNGQWSVPEELEPANVIQDGEFGVALAVQSTATKDFLFVGRTAGISTASSGDVTIFERASTGGAWSLVTTLSPPSAANGFSRALAVDGDRLMVGDSTGNFHRAYVYVAPGGQWANLGPTPSTLPIFNVSTPNSQDLADVALRGDLAVIGDRNYDTRGQLLLYQHDGLSWNNGDYFVNPTIQGGEFGRRLAVEDGLILTGTYSEGHAYIYALVGERCVMDSECPTEFCSDQFCCDQRCAGCGECNAQGSAGECQPRAAGEASPDCGPYLCNGTDLDCSFTCTSDADCTADHYCDGTHCVPDEVPGTSCSDASSCASGHCVDGVCCDTACDAQCAACDVTDNVGTCTLVEGAPHAPRESCPADQCEDGVASADYTCTGADDTCQPTELACAPYRCGEDACRDRCEVDDDCVGGFICLEQRCVSDGTTCDGSVITEPGGTTIDCAPYRCDDSDLCPQSCTNAADCVDGYTCSSQGRCVERAEPASPDTGCACHAAGSDSTPGSWGVAALLASIALRRRRSRPKTRRAPLAPVS